MKRKKITALLLAVLLCLSCAACHNESDPAEKPSAGQSGTVTGGSTLSRDPGDHFSDRDYDDSISDFVTVTLVDCGSTADGPGVNVDGNTVTVTKEGAYRFTGDLSNGQIRVEVGDQEKVQLILDGASVSCAGSAALYVLSADKVFVTLAEDSQNFLSSTGEFQQTDENNVDAAVFAKADLTFNGAGSLGVICEAAHGIVTKDDLKITGGSYAVTAAKQGITGKDSIRIHGGNITVSSGTDGLHSKHDEDAAKGYIFIADGTINITSGNDGMDASSEILILDGEITVFTGDGSESVAHHSDGGWGGGMGGWQDNGSDSATEESRKALKAAVCLTVAGGKLNLDAEDDAIHSNGEVCIASGSFAIATGDDGIHADGTLIISGGQLEITKSYEGLEGTYMTIAGGEINLITSDDGLNAAGGNDGSGMAGPWGHGGFGEATDAYILITGGSLTVNAGGDGIDSNGDLTVTGGTVYVDGPTNGGNGPLDYAGTAKITGGTFIALGAAGMAMNFGETSTQGSILCSLNGFAPAGTVVSVSDSQGNLLASYASQKSYQSILISAPGMEQGQTYTVTVGEASADFTLDSIIHGSGSGMGGGGMGGGRPGRP